MNKLLRDILLGGAPVIVGLGTVLVQGIAIHVLDPWVIGGAVVSGLLTIYMHFATVAAETPK